jgi:hypothetical protein
VPKQYRFDYEVSGVGHFPADMLRHDQAWPASEFDSGKISQSTYDARTVRLTGLNDPTVGRWESFGWAVRAVDRRVIA